MGSASPTRLAVYTLRVDRDHLDRLAEIATREHRTLVQKLRLMIERELESQERAA